MAPANTPQIMGILNITPDSFSDGGSLLQPEAVSRRVEEMVSQGVDILDVGGESTRPFADAVGKEEELDRVVPVIERIRQLTDLPVSIDTTKAVVAAEALAAGATMVNDISALRADPGMVEIVSRSDCAVCIMHMQGTPRTMQVDPHYENVVEDILTFFRERIAWLTARGIARENIIVDPGIGFGKTLAHNLQILRSTVRFRETGCPVLIGHSRKSFLQGLLDLEVDQRDCATAMVSLFCAMNGAQILRVHDVGLTRQALEIAARLSGE